MPLTRWLPTALPHARPTPFSGRFGSSPIPPSGATRATVWHCSSARTIFSPIASPGRLPRLAAGWKTLFLLVDAPGWKHDAEVAPVYDVVDGADDLLDRAAVHTQCRGGHVYTIPAARMPAEDPVAATLRY
jgi:hypothetical protein